MIVLALLLALQAPLQDSAAEPGILMAGPIRIETLPAARAFDAFRAICMNHFPDPAAFDAAAAASDLGFTRSESADRGTQEWSSPHGQITFRQADARRRDREDRGRGRRGEPRLPMPWLARCDFWVGIDENLPVPDLLAAIGQHLTSGRVQPREEIIGFAWDLGANEAGQKLRLVYLQGPDDPRLFTLSLQQLPDIRAH